MENPATWGPAEHAVNRVLHERQVNRSRPVEEQVIGPSLVRMITDALRAEGLLVERRPDLGPGGVPRGEGMG